MIVKQICFMKFTGTARLLEIVWLLSHNCDFEAADTTWLNKRTMFLDLLPPDFELEKDRPLLVESSPIVGKTHFPYSILKKLLASKKECRKIVVGFRNPKDTLVSNYHFYRMNSQFGNFTGSWDDFFDLYRQGRLVYGCPMDMMLDWWKQRDNKNVLIVKYEDFAKMGSLHVIKNIATFLGYNYNNETLQAVANRISFNTMKTNSSTNFSSFDGMQKDISPYMRKGEVGDWQNYFSDEQNAFLDKIYKDKCILEGLSFSFV